MNPKPAFNNAADAADAKPFLEAVRNGDAVRVAQALSAAPGMATARHEATGWTALIIAAKNGHDDIAKQLLKAGADIEAADAAGFTPLMHACLAGQGSTARLLTEAGAYAGRRNRMGMTAASCARGADFPSLGDEMDRIAQQQPEALKKFWQREVAGMAGGGTQKPVAVRRNPVRFKPT